MSQLVQSHKSPLDQAFWALIVAICVVMGAGICVMGLSQSGEKSREAEASTSTHRPPPPRAVAQAQTQPATEPAETATGPTFSPQGIEEEPDSPAIEVAPRPGRSRVQTVSARSEGLEGIERRLDEIVTNLTNLPDRFARNPAPRGAGDQSVEFVREFRQLLETARHRSAAPLDTPPVATRSHSVSRTPARAAEPAEREVPPAAEPGEAGSLTFDGGIESADEPVSPQPRVARGIPPTTAASPADDLADDNLATDDVTPEAPTGETSDRDIPAAIPEVTPTRETLATEPAAPLGSAPDAATDPESPADELPNDIDLDATREAEKADRPHTSATEPIEPTPGDSPDRSTDPEGPAVERTEGGQTRAETIDDESYSTTATGPDLSLAPSGARLPTLTRPPLPVEVPGEGLPTADQAVAPANLPSDELAPLNRRSETAIEVLTPRHLSAEALARVLEPQLTAGVGDIRSTEDASGRAGRGNHTARPAVVVRDTPENLVRLRRLADEADVPSARTASTATPTAGQRDVSAPADRRTLVLDVTAVAVRLNRANSEGIDLSQLAQRRAGFELHSLQESTRRGEVRLASGNREDEAPELNLGVLTGNQQRLLQELRITGPVSVVARSRVTLKDGQATRLAVEEQIHGNQAAQRSSCVGVRPRLQADGSLLLQLLDCEQPAAAGREPLAEMRVAEGETAVLAGLRSQRPVTVRDGRAQGGATVSSQPVEWVYLVTPRPATSR